MPAMNAVFFAMLQWCGIAFVLLAVGSLLCWRCRARSNACAAFR